MALSKNKVDVVFTKGVNSKLDSKTTLAADLLALENRVFNKTGAVDKRFGFEAIGDKDCATGTVIPDFNAITTYDTKSLILMADTKLYDYSATSDSWVSKGSLQSASINLETIVSNANEQTETSIFSVNGITACVWKDSDGSVRYSLQDDTTGSFYVVDEEVHASGTIPNVIGLGANIMFLFVSGNDLSYKIVSTGDPCGGFFKTGNIQTDAHASGIYDLETIGNTGTVAYKTTSNVVKLVAFNHLGALQNLVVTTQAVDDVISLYTYANVAGTASNFTVGAKATSSLVRVGIYSQGFAELSAFQDIDTTASTDISKMIAVRTSTDVDSVSLYWQVPGTFPSDDLIKTRTLSLAGSLGTASTFLRGSGIASKGFNGPSGGLAFNILHESDLQATVFTVDVNGDVLSKFSAGNAGTHVAIGATPSNVSETSPGVFKFAMNTKGVIRSENATLFSRLGVSIATIDFTSLNTFSNTNLNKNLFVVGGLLNLYDGKTTSEQGFHLFPESMVNNTTATTGGSMEDGTYLYRAVYRWTDGQGNIHTSAPSAPLSVTLSGGTSTQTQTVDIPTLRITTKEKVTIEIFRTETTGSIFHKLTSVTSPELNDATVDTLTFVDDAADTSIISNEILYTVGGILDNISAPSCDIVTTHQNRLFLAGLQNKNEVRFSKIVRSGEGVSFNELLSITVDPAGGPITNLASMDSNLIIFKENNIYAVAGEGPSDTGLNTTFTEPELIATDVGCTDVNSLVLGPSGLYFKSAKGIYLLTRGLEAVYVGAPVQDFNAETITSSVLSDDSNEIRFTTATGVMLVFNYFYDQWSTFTKKNVVDSTLWSSKHVYIDVSGNIAKESSETHKDLNAFVSSKVATGWIRSASLAGYQRTWKVSVLGEYKSKHKLRITVYTDYSVIPTQTKDIDVSSFLSIDSDQYGDDVYGNSTPYGGAGNEVYEFQVHIKDQKNQAIRFEIEDIFDNSLSEGNNGQGMSLTGIQLLIGTKRGLNKVGSSKKG